MWDEQEGFGKIVTRGFTWVLAALGVGLAAASLATGSPEFFLAFLQVLGYVAVIVLAYGLVAGCVGGVLLGSHWGLNRCVCWLRNWFKRG